MAQFYGLQHFADAGSLARGLIYASQGKSTVSNKTDTTIEASTLGTGGNVYDQWIDYSFDGQAITGFYGSCS